MSNNYFTSPTGKVVTQWPYGNVPYRVLTKLLGRVSETTLKARAPSGDLATDRLCDHVRSSRGGRARSVASDSHTT